MAYNLGKHVIERSFLIFLFIVFFFGSQFACGSRTVSLATETSEKEVKFSSSYQTSSNNQNSLASGANNNQQKKLTYLKEWIGKPPINEKDSSFKNFYLEPEVKKILVSVIGNVWYKKLVDCCYLEVPIEEIDGFLYVENGTMATQLEPDLIRTVVLLNTNSGETHVFWFKNFKLVFHKSNVSDDSNITDNIKAKLIVLRENQNIINNLTSLGEGFSNYSEVIEKLKNTGGGSSLYCIAIKESYGNPDSVETDSLKTSEFYKGPYMFIFKKDKRVARFNILNNEIELTLKSTKRKEYLGDEELEMVFMNEDGKTRATLDEINLNKSIETKMGSIYRDVLLRVVLIDKQIHGFERVRMLCSSKVDAL